MKIHLLVFSLIIYSSGVFSAPLEYSLVDSKSEKGLISCALCNSIISDVFTGFETGQTDEEISAGIAQRCETLNLYNYKVCYGTAFIAMPTIRYIYSLGLVEGNICGMLLQTENCGFSDPGLLEWSVTPSSIPKPPVTEPALPPDDSPTLKVLHLSDIHWDPEYLEGSNAVCTDPMCCRASSGDVVNATDAAGYWGDRRGCDIPWRTIENAVAHIAQQHSDVSYIIWTGDLIPHDTWSTDKDENLMIIDSLMTLMQQYFPGVPMYPTLGNHESHPVNTFAPPEITDVEFNTAWLYDEADRQWARWLPAEVSSTVRYGGFYTTLAQPGLRIVSMNMNYCYIFNYWTYYKSQDPASILTWLNQVLEDAELAGEKVHILSHIPPGNGDCWTIFSREFAKIINRFESTVAAQFYGHTHNDEYKIFYDLVELDRAVNVAFVAPSLTASSDNAGYRIYTIDGPRPGSTWAVLDHSSWIMNLTVANADPSISPVWFELYQAKQDYGLTDLSPRSMDVFYQRLVTDDALFQLYFAHYYKKAEERLEKGCDADCRTKLLCFIVTTDPLDQSRCQNIRRQLLSQHPEF
ncbi:sphingomyelin phosphodiesterase-like [Daphnia pulex]|uniref:sphingomyelin phosphodiesterase-like n=1 Tax=Daphnia pulex TaxID=6669 RepID=UPI001EDF79AC|nr:sphingomyelin phosphodiesterase-like [Daphnia pulex]